MNEARQDELNVDEPTVEISSGEHKTPAIRLFQKGIEMYNEDKAIEAMNSFKDALVLVQGQEEDAKRMACALRQNIVTCIRALATYEDRGLDQVDRGESFCLLLNAVRDASSEEQRVKYHIQLAELSLENLNDPNVSIPDLVSSNMHLNECANSVLQSNLQDIDDYKSLCTKYVAEASAVVMPWKLRGVNFDIQSNEDVDSAGGEDVWSASAIPFVKRTRKYGEQSFLYNSYLFTAPLIATCKKLLQEGNLNNNARAATIDLYNIYKKVEDSGMDAEVFKTKFNDAFAKWEAAMNSTKSYKGRTNSSEPLSPLTEVGVILNWATPDSLVNTINNGTYHIDESNGCITTAKISIPSSLHREAGGDCFDADMKANLREKITVRDFQTSIPLEKDGHEEEFTDQIPNELEISDDVYNLFCALASLGDTCYYFLKHGQPLPTFVMGMPVYTTRFGNCGRVRTDKMIFCGHMAHPECYCSGWLSNSLVFTPDKLPEFDKTAVYAISHVKGIRVPGSSRMSFRFAKVDNMTDEEIMNRAEATRKHCIKGGKKAGVLRTQAKLAVMSFMESNPGMSKKEAIEMLEVFHPAAASIYEGCFNGYAAAVESTYLKYKAECLQKYGATEATITDKQKKSFFAKKYYSKGSETIARANKDDFEKEMDTSFDNATGAQFNSFRYRKGSETIANRNKDDFEKKMGKKPENATNSDFNSYRVKKANESMGVKGRRKRALDGAKTLGAEGRTKKAKKAAESKTGKKSPDWTPDEEALLWKIYTNPGHYECKYGNRVNWKIASKLFRDALTPEYCMRKAGSMKKIKDREEKKNK